MVAIGHTRQGVQQHHLNPTEDGGIGGDADCQREHGHQGESGASAQNAKAITKVLK
jgi:hypothetical protein